MKSVRIFWDLFGSLGILGPSDTNVAPTYAQHSNVRLLIGLIVVIGIKQASYQSLDNGVASD